MFDDKNNNIDDLIGSSQQPIIIHEGGSDKKFLYTLLIVLVLLFIIALGLIAYLGGKYFGGGNESYMPRVAVTQAQDSNVQKPSVAIAEPISVKKEVQRSNVVSKDNTSVGELEALVNNQEQAKATAVAKPRTTVEKAITKVASSSRKKGLSQEELEKIAQLVAQELAKAKVVQKTNSNINASSASTSRKKDDALVASLQQAEADTLNDTAIDTLKVDKNANVTASSSKKVDTFNKVVVEKKGGGDDELSKLSAEIDTILQSEDVKKEEKNLKFKKAFDKEANLRASELRFIVVRQGDTLSSIAHRAYGRASAYNKIYQANPDLVKNPNKIYIGMKLRVPVDEEYKNFNKGN